MQRTRTEALAHIEDRINAENIVKNNLAEMIEKSTEETTPAQAADLIAILDECLRRHAALQASLQEVGERFRAEQERQAFVSPPLRSCVDLGHQLLRPTLELPTQQAWAAAGWHLHDEPITVTPEIATGAVILAALGQLHVTNNWHRLAREWLYDEPPTTDMGRAIEQWRRTRTRSGAAGG